MSWRLTAVVVIAVALAGVLGGLRLLAAAESNAQFGRVAQLAVLGQRVTSLAHAMEDERDQTAGFIAAGRPASGVEAVQRAYAVTNAMARNVQSAAAGIGAAFPSSTRAAVTAVLDRVSDLDGLRDAALHTQLPSLPVINDYSESIADLFSLNDDIAQGSGDSTLENSVRTLGSLSQMVEDASEQRALMYAALTEHQFEPGALQDLITAQAAQASDLTSFQASATLAEQQTYENTVAGSPTDLAQLMEQHAIEVGGPQTAGLGVSAAAAPRQWYSAMSATIGQMRQVEAQVADSVVAQSRALRRGPERSALLTGALTVSFLLLVLLVTLVFARSLVLPLRRLRAGALDIATSSLPARVRELGESPDPSSHLDVQPIGVHSTDEIGQVARAFDLVHSEAVRLAGNEAILRRNVSAMFVSLSRRSQSLIERLGQLMQSAGQQEQDPARRSEFSAMEHLVVRMRRNSENLLVLAGYEAVRRWSGSVSLEELARAAVAEIEQQDRVDLEMRPGILVSGQAATDVVRLLAELIENGTRFSPRETRVVVSGSEVASGGALIEINDTGVGVSPGRLTEMNERLDDPPVADVSVSRHMGLFAVSHLAARHRVRVRLRARPPEGLTALVWLPDGIVERREASSGVAGFAALAGASTFGGGSGLAGASGLVGDSGASSFAGASGLVGASGASGLAGASGSVGGYGSAGGGYGRAAESAPTGLSGLAQSLRVGGYVPGSGPRRAAHERLAPYPIGTAQPDASNSVPSASGPVVAPPVAPLPAPVAAPPAEPVVGGLTAEGLPMRIPQANSVRGMGGFEGKGAHQRPQPRPPAPPIARSPDAARSRLGGFQSGTRRAEQRITRAGEGADQERTDG